MKTELVTKLYDGLMSLTEEEKETVIELETGDKIVLKLMADAPYIIFKSKNPNMCGIGFDGFSFYRDADKAISVIEAIKTFAKFYKSWQYAFRELTCRDPEKIQEGFGCDWSFDDGRIAYNREKVVVACDDWKQGIEELIEFFKELTLLTTGCEVDEELYIISEEKE